MFLTVVGFDTSVHRMLYGIIFCKNTHFFRYGAESGEKKQKEYEKGDKYLPFTTCEPTVTGRREKKYLELCEKSGIIYI